LALRAAPSTGFASRSVASPVSQSRLQGLPAYPQTPTSPGAPGLENIDAQRISPARTSLGRAAETVSGPRPTADALFGRRGDVGAQSPSRDDGLISFSAPQSPRIVNASYGARPPARMHVPPAMPPVSAGPNGGRLCRNGPASISTLGGAAGQSRFDQGLKNNRNGALLHKPIVTLSKDELPGFFKGVGYSDWGLPEELNAAALLDPKVLKLEKIKKDALEVGKKAAAELGIQRPHNNEADALRHTYLAIRLAREFGPVRAASILNAHERTAVNPTGERLMDLINNKNGTILSEMFPDMPPEELARMAMNAGLLQTREVKVAPKAQGARRSGGSN